MNLGLFLAIGESLTDFKNKGQLDRLLNYNVKKYLENFDKVFIFSYENEQFKLPSNCLLVPNDSGLHRYLYAIILPFLKKRYVKECHVLRGLQLSGGIPALVSKIFFGKKYIINYGYDYQSFAKLEDKLFQSYLYRIIRSPILKSADAVIVTSQEIKKKVAKIIKSSRIYFIPNGVDTKLFKPFELPRNQDSLKIVYIGRLERQKNLDNLIRAISIIGNETLGHTKNAQLRDFGISELFFYGRGSLKNHLLRLAKKLKVYLEIKSPVPYRNVPKILAYADIFVLPSLEEGSPKILLEAMSSGRAVVGSNVKGIRELIIDGETGIIAQTDPASIARSISKLKDTKIRNRIGISAAKYAREHFDIDKLLAKEVDLLTKTAANI